MSEKKEHVSCAAAVRAARQTCGAASPGSDFDACIASIGLSRSAFEGATECVVSGDSDRIFCLSASKAASETVYGHVYGAPSKCSSS